MEEVNFGYKTYEIYIYRWIEKIIVKTLLTILLKILATGNTLIKNQYKEHIGWGGEDLPLFEM